MLALGALFNRGDVNAASLRTTLLLRVNANLTSSSDFAEASAPVFLEKQDVWANGAAAQQAQLVFSDKRTLAASTTDDLDLAGGALTDPFGAAFSPAKLRAVIITASATNTNTVVVGGDVNAVPITSTAATTVTLQPGASFVLTAPALAGIAVTAGTGDILQIANGGAGTSVEYSVVLIGTSS